MRARVDLSAGGRGELDREMANATARTVDQDLAPQERAALTQSVERRQAGNGQGGSLSIHHAIRKDRNAVERHVYLLGPCAGREKAGDTDTSLRFVCTGGCFDHTRRSPSRIVRQSPSS